MEVQIISKEIVKPSSPTPFHLKTFKLSLLDQLIPAPYAPLVLFYPNYDTRDLDQIAENLQLLKQSLSRTFSNFYPLAGTIKDDLSIDCNDHGAYFVTAKVNNVRLFEFLTRPNLNFITRFLPCDPSFMGSMSGKPVTNIQINLFECGGIAIGICISHKVLDGLALKTFLKSWAGISTKTDQFIVPDFISSSLFPANDDLWLRDSSMVMWGSSFKKGKSITKRFVFYSSAINSLKKSMATGSNTPTRVEAISAFLWKFSKEASEEIHGGNKRASMLTHIVNLRKRAIPSLSENSIGNLIWISSAKFPANSDLGLASMADQVRLSISRIDGNYVKNLCGNKGSALMRKSLKEIGEFGSSKDDDDQEEEEKVDYFGFSSWCGFGFYYIDFGWGKPIWVSSYAIDANVFMNLVILLETRNGDGIEAWVTLDQQEMDILQHNKEFLAFASLDPSPLNNVIIPTSSSKTNSGLVRVVPIESTSYSRKSWSEVLSI